MDKRTYCKNMLCDEDLTSNTSFRKWSLKNHPDKNKGASALIKFQKMSACKDELTVDSSLKLNCEKSSNRGNRGKTPASSDEDLITADCLRRVENWSIVERYHRFDKPSFNKEQVIKDMKTYSPKMDELIKNIRKLDEKDKNESGKLFKHFIFSDVRKGGYGSKIIASSLIAHGFNSCFKFNGWEKLSIQKPDKHKEKETFGLLSSTAVYKSSFTQKNVKKVLSIYNNRPDNVYGDDMRVIILDSGFKEGIDLFDVKYVHIFEEQTNTANLTQAVGRATRSCGQKGLNFVPNEGWLLHVYKYKLFYNEDTFLYKDFFKYMGINFEELNLIQNLEKLAIASSVDFDLNRNIHEFSRTTGGNSVENSHLGCYSGKCGSRSTKSIPFSLIFFEKMYKAYYKKNINKKENAKKQTKEKRDFFCKLLKSDKAFCAYVNEKYRLIKKPKSKHVSTENPYTSSKKEREPSEQNMIVMRENIKSASDNMNFQDFQKHIFKTFKKYKYEPLQIINNCDKQFENSQNKKDERLITFSESQDFVTKYFTPQRNIKGMLIWHSVGTGKTCTALSVKSFLYEKQGYTIIWVTRSTLKEDIWKNMFDKVCDHVIRDRIAKGEDIPINPENVRKYVGKHFLKPMSYRQFSNLVEGKNTMSEEMKRLNGTTEDILRKSLIIVDEAHKLYSKDLVSMERPNMTTLSKAIHNSYEVSGTDSCKLLLMTATPVADNMMEFFKLTNLLQHDRRKRFPENIKELKEREIIRENDFTEKGKTMFQDNLKGLISYLDRRNDPRQFAQPVFHNMPVKISNSNSKKEYDECVKNSNQEKDKCMEDEELDKEFEFLINTLSFEIGNKKYLQGNIISLKKELSLENKKLTKTFMKNNTVNVEAVKLRQKTLKDSIDDDKKSIDKSRLRTKDTKHKLIELSKEQKNAHKICHKKFISNMGKCEKDNVSTQVSVLKKHCKYII